MLFSIGWEGVFFNRTYKKPPFFKGGWGDLNVWNNVHNLHYDVVRRLASRRTKSNNAQQEINESAVTQQILSGVFLNVSIVRNPSNVGLRHDNYKAGVINERG